MKKTDQKIVQDFLDLIMQPKNIQDPKTNEAIRATLGATFEETYQLNEILKNQLIK